jgi:uncharacterized protein YprB with RNaseH-like and TPR domain
MNLPPQEYLDLVEETGKIVFFDIEAIGLKADYGSVICVSFKSYGHKPYSLSIKQAGNDQRLVREAKEELEKYSCWVSYYGKGFDIKYLDTRLLKWGLPPVDRRPHVDLFFTLKSNILTGHKSQSHLLSWLKTESQKMSVSASDWSELPFKMSQHLPTMIKRCESDVMGLEALYKKTRHVIKDIKR